MTQAAGQLLEHEARALLTRLARVKPFALHEPMLPAAMPSTEARTAIESYLADGRRELRTRVMSFIRWISSAKGTTTPPGEAQRHFTLLRLRFNAVLSQFDLFNDAISQRSEHDTGVWLAGLDVVARDALTIAGGYFDPPPVICYLDRGPGAAIRRARTRLPGGGDNPVAIIRVPRERMVGSGIASSLVHEVGHQACSQLDLATSLGPMLQAQLARTKNRAWWYWERWISEILSDLWSVAKIGIGSTQGLMSVVSLPAPFVVRLNEDDPHPTPWIRVKLSAAIGDALWPHPQWRALASIWESLYPLDGLEESHRATIMMIQAGIAEFVRALLEHRPASLRGASLREAMGTASRSPQRLAELYRAWGNSLERMRTAPPTIVFAAIGQARADGVLSPEREGEILDYLLRYWALRQSLGGVMPVRARAEERSNTVNQSKSLIQ